MEYMSDHVAVSQYAVKNIHLEIHLEETLEQLLSRIIDPVQQTCQRH